MESRTSNLDAVISNYRWGSKVSDEAFKMMMLGAAVIDNIFGDNEDHSRRVDQAFNELEAVLEHGEDGKPAPALHQWETVNGGYALICCNCGVLQADCGATTESWLCEATPEAA